MAEVPCWQKLASEVASRIENSSNREFDSERKKHYDAGYKAAARGEARRSKICGEDPRLFTAWIAGYYDGNR
jgi:hypothetical protein